MRRRHRRPARHRPSSPRGLLPLLAMGRDVPDGRMYLKRGRLDVDWSRARSEAYFDRVRATSRSFAHALGGKYRDSPIWFLRRVTTVHPLGGAPMGRTADEGVVDPYGNVFGYPGLHVADGSVMPGAGRAPIRASRSPRSPTASPTGCSRPPPPRRRLPHDRNRDSARHRPLHRGDARSRHLRGGGLHARRRPRPAGRRAAEVPPHDRGGGHRAVRQRSDAPGRGARLPGVRCARRPAAGRARRLQPVHRHRAGRQADALPAVVPRRRRAPADAQRPQAGAQRRRVRRLARHHDAVHARAEGPRGGGRGRRGGGVRRAADPDPRLRAPAHDVPRGRRRPSASKLGALVKFGWIFLGQLAETYLRKGRRSNGQAKK